MELTKQDVQDWMEANSQVTTFEFPDDVTSIGDYAFFNCSGLKEIKIPDSVTRIGVYALCGCSGLISIQIPESVTSIGQSAFLCCSGLTSIEIPDSVTSIGDSAFSGCSSLQSIVIPESVTSIGDGAFAACSSLESIEIPKGVTSIGFAAFGGCSGLTSIEIPERVTSIGDRAFRGCSSLQSIVFPDGVMSIGNEALSGCRQLSHIIAPERLHQKLAREYPSKTVITLEQAIEEGRVDVDERLCEKAIKYSLVNNSGATGQEARPEEIRSIVTSLSPLAKASLFSYAMPAGHHWVKLSARQIVRVFWDAPAYLLNLIGYRVLNRFTVMNHEDVGKEEITKYISIKDRLNLAMVAKQVDLGAAYSYHEQNPRESDNQDANNTAQASS